MKRIAMFVALVLATAAMMVPASAATSTTDATANFTGSPGSVIIPPEDPDEEGENNPDNPFTDPDEYGDLTITKDNTGLDFGTAEIQASKMMTMNSVVDASETDPDIKKRPGQYVGVIVSDARGEAKGLWDVTVSIDGFKTAVGSRSVLQGYTLDLTPKGLVTSNAGYNPATSPKPVSNTLTGATTLKETIYDTDGTTVLTDNSQKLFYTANGGDGRGTWGNKWAGTLSFHGSTAEKGAAKATMTWNIQDSIAP